ncbi:hypothetical protein ACS5PU_20565 [Pedobacter sp. GSP4]|uniref:hypothetical protein n=1 Tax=Pedobacter sp. GSP4 TaxID=3453716 RepID=UPI003EEA3D02
MKKCCFALALILWVSLAMGQNVKPYIAILKTTSGKHKGILYKVDSAYVILNDNGEFDKIAINDIKTVQIRTIKKNYKGINLIKIGSDPEEYQLNSRGDKVNKWGKKMPSPEDELGVAFFSVIFTGIANGLAAPIHAINPNVARFNLRQKDVNKLNELNYFSVYYQANANVLTELEQIKKISASFKP